MQKRTFELTVGLDTFQLRLPPVSYNPWHYDCPDDMFDPREMTATDEEIEEILAQEYPGPDDDYEEEF